MQNAIIDWLLTDYPLFGLHIQYWMPVVILVFVVFLVFSSLDQRISRK